MMKYVTAVIVGLVLSMGAAPAFADEPDYTTQPEWGAEWRDREFTVVCNPDGTNERVVQQSMWRPTEPEWDGTQWVVFDDWREWAWPEAAQTIYKPVEPGDCPPVDVAISEPAETPAAPELAVTGEQAPWWVMPAGVALAVSGVAVIWAGRRRTNDA